MGRHQQIALPEIPRSANPRLANQLCIRFESRVVTAPRTFFAARLATRKLRDCRLVRWADVRLRRLASDEDWLTMTNQRAILMDLGGSRTSPPSQSTKQCFVLVPNRGFLGVGRTRGSAVIPTTSTGIANSCKRQGSKVSPTLIRFGV
jgi:hypothetical protein